MALLKYLLKRDGTLPDPYGRLSDFIEPCLIQQINDEMSEQSSQKEKLHPEESMLCIPQTEGRDG